MNIDLPEQTIRGVEAVIAGVGGGVDVPAYIDRSVRRAIFFDTVGRVQALNAQEDPEELQRLIDEAVDAVRTQSKGVYPHADRA